MSRPRLRDKIANGAPVWLSLAQIAAITIGSKRMPVAFVSIVAPSANPTKTNCAARGVSFLSRRKQRKTVNVASVAVRTSFVT
jgi:hypothetical protein